MITLFYGCTLLFTALVIGWFILFIGWLIFWGAILVAINITEKLKKKFPFLVRNTPRMYTEEEARFYFGNGDGKLSFTDRERTK